MELKDFLGGLLNSQTGQTNAPGQGQGMFMPQFMNNYQGYQPNMTGVSIAPPGGGGFFGGDTMNKLFGNDKAMGVLTGGAQIGQALMNGFLGWKQQKMAQEQFDMQKDMFNKNWTAQTTDYNRQIADTANARASATGDTAAAQQYIDKNRIA